MCPFFQVLSSVFNSRQSVISRDKESSFSFPSNKLESFLFTSQSSASRCVCTHRAERAIFRDTNTPELAHAHTHTHTHKKKGTNTFLSLYPSLSLSFSLHSVLLFFSSATTERDDDDDDSMSLARPHQPFGKFKSSSSRGGNEEKEEDTERAILSLYMSFCLRLSLSLCLSVSFCRFSEY